MPNHFEAGRELAPEKLTREEAEEIVKEIGDARLSLDPAHEEYFALKTPEGTRRIMRLRFIPHAQDDGTVAFMRIEQHLRQALAELDQNSAP